jgi:hypothetical protein
VIATVTKLPDAQIVPYVRYQIADHWVGADWQKLKNSTYDS